MEETQFAVLPDWQISKSRCCPRTPSYSPPWPKHLWKIWIAYARRSRVFLINSSL
jgi:hypothetical protein